MCALWRFTFNDSHNLQLTHDIILRHSLMSCFLTTCPWETRFFTCQNTDCLMKSSLMPCGLECRQPEACAGRLIRKEGGGTQPAALQYGSSTVAEATATKLRFLRETHHQSNSDHICVHCVMTHSTDTSTIHQWCKALFSKISPRGALRAVSPLSTQIGVFDFFLAFATSKIAF